MASRPGSGPESPPRPAPDKDNANRTRRRAFAWLRAGLTLAVVVALFVYAIPMISGAPWADVRVALTSITLAQILVLAFLWLGGLATHTITLTAALPRLSHRRALALSLTGSAVANVLFVGGAAGIAMNYKMARTWGFQRAAIATYTVVTNIWDVLGKLCLPAFAVGVLALSGDALAVKSLFPTFLVSVGMLVVVVLIGAMVTSPRRTATIGGHLDRGLTRAAHVVGLPREVHLTPTLLKLQRECASVIRAAWTRLTAGIVAYLFMLGALLYTCLWVSHANLPLSAVIAGLAGERLLTLAGLTPGGAGIIEVGLSGLLLLLGGSPVGVVEGVLLYRIFTYGMEIPVGGTTLAAWFFLQRRNRAATA